jgi:type IX secretion system PorP/SprF family membrane protein
MRNTLYIIIALLVSTAAYSQQLPETTPIQDLQHVWNPAFLAPGTEMEVSAFYRKKWVGFDNAPNTAFVTIQYPFVDQNMSAGASIISDKTGPVSKLGLQLSYAYKLKEIFKRDDQISLGVQGYLYQYKFNPNGEVTTSPDDILLMNNASQTRFNPSMGFGFAYRSYDEEFDGENIFYFGGSVMQFLESELALSSATAPRERHYFMNVGGKFFSYDYYIEPSVQVNYVNPEIIDIVLGAKFEMEETFWAGLNYSSINDLSINGGVILNDVGDRYSYLKIGAIAGINVGDVFSAGPGFEFYVGYVFDVD